MLNSNPCYNGECLKEVCVHNYHTFNDNFMVNNLAAFFFFFLAKIQLLLLKHIYINLI